MPVGVRRLTGGANWLTQCSFDPPMLALAVDNEAHSLGLIRESGTFSVNFFASGQRRQAGRLARPASRAPDKLGEFEQRDGETGAPLLTGLLGYLECRVAGECAAGDHTIFVASIVAAGTFAADAPLEIHQAGFNYAG